MSWSIRCRWRAHRLLVASLRFDGTLTVDITEFLTFVVPYPENCM